MLNPILASKCGINQEWLESVIITTPTIGEDAMLDKILVSRCRKWLERVIIVTLCRLEDAVLNQYLVSKCGINQEWLDLYRESDNSFHQR